MYDKLAENLKLAYDALAEITATDGNTYYISLTVDETKLKHCSIYLCPQINLNKNKMEVIMKKTALILAVIFTFMTLTACSENNAENTLYSKGTERVSDDSHSTTESTVKDSFKRIEHSYDSVVCNFNYDQKEAVNDLRITLDIPDYLVEFDDGNKNCPDYVSYDKELGGYTRTFEMLNVHKVDRDFVMDESLLVKTRSAGVVNIANDHKYDISKGVTDTGYDYVLFEDLRHGFFDIAYIRISDEYIAAFMYSDDMEHYALMRHCLNSVQIVK